MNPLAKIAALGAMFVALGGFASAPADPIAGEPRQTAQSRPSPAPAAHPLTAEDLSAYFDGMLPSEMERADIAGVVLVVVKDGQPLFERG